MSSEPLFTTRREFLAGSLTFLSAASTMPMFLSSTAQALAGPEPASKKKKADERILVVLQMAGGNDGLNTVIPYSMDAYYKFRRQLGIAKDRVLKLEDGVGLHPAATGLKSLFDDGRLAIIQGVGYPNPNRSHFTSMDIWHTADPQQRAHEGWIGRYFDACCAGSDPGGDPLEGIALMQEAPLAMSGEHFTPLAFDNPDALTWRPGQKDSRAAAAFRTLNNLDNPQENAKGELAEYLQRAALNAQLGSEQIRGAVSGSGGGRRRGRGQLAQQLQTVARMILSDLPTRIYYVSMGGFDTHSGQLGRHQQLMTQLGEALQDFVATLAENKVLDRVLVLTFSEFGRRVQENASGGTDHGEAAPMFLIGSKIKPGVHEKHPDLDNLHRGDLQFGCDFRRVYAAVLRDWLKTKPDKVLGGGFAPYPVIKVG